MADIDTKVLYLETPPTSAPKTSYILGVRIRNVGIHARTAQGYVQVFDKDTGMLVKTYQVESAEIDPGEEKQAFASEAWDLTDELVGKQFILSGMMTCDGDMVPENDILNPTTVTVADTPPGPPPAVTPHKHQHEDGGNDELDLTGLHGVLGDPQPYADHASKHQDDGSDQLNLGGLAGLAADPQIPTDHGNERHAVPFATSSELGNHEADTDTHSVAANLEQTANKEQPDGYPGLDGSALISPARLAPDPHSSRFLRGDRTWQPGTMPPANLPRRFRAGLAPAMGPGSDYPAPAEHQHGGMGGIMWDGAENLSGAGPHILGTSYVRDGCLHTLGIPEGTAAIRFSGYLSCDNPGAVPDQVDIRLYAGRYIEDMYPRTLLPIPVDALLENGTAFFNILGLMYSNWGEFAGHVVGTLSRNSPIVAVPWSGTGLLDFEHELVFQLSLTIAGQTVVSEVRYDALLELIAPDQP